MASSGILNSSILADMANPALFGRNYDPTKVSLVTGNTGIILVPYRLYTHETVLVLSTIASVSLELSVSSVQNIYDTENGVAGAVASMWTAFTSLSALNQDGLKLFNVFRFPLTAIRLTNGSGVTLNAEVLN